MFSARPRHGEQAVVARYHNWKIPEIFSFIRRSSFLQEGPGGVYLSG
jgi:hypothetical protein